MRNNLWILVACALATGVAALGCSKQKDGMSSASVQAAPEIPQISDLQASVEAYEKIYKRKPVTLEQMVREGFIPSIPPAPAGKRFYLDPTTGRLTVVTR